LIFKQLKKIIYIPIKIIKYLFNNIKYLNCVTYKNIILISNKCLNLSIYDYKKIAKPFKKNHITNEIWYYNEVYGFSYILKKYIGYKYDYKLKFIATHAVKYRILTGPGFSWEFTQNSPMIFTNSLFAKELIEKFVDNTVKVIPGSLQILYATMLYDSEQFKKEKTKLGKNLLVFPAHSNSIINSYYDISNLIKEILKIKKEHNFDSVTICLFCRDIARGIDKQYIGYDFNITCAGHILDCHFFSRLRTIIELSNVVMANSDTSAMWYSLSLEKPFYLWNDTSINFKNIVNVGDPEYDEGWFELHKKNKEISEIKKAFGEYNESITDTQKILVDKYCDTKNFKSPDEMREIFIESEKMYLSGKYKTYERKIVKDSDV